MRTSSSLYLIRRPEDHGVLGDSDFGMPGLSAVESIWPSVAIRPFSDSRLENGALLTLELASAEGELASVREGRARLEESEDLIPGATLLAPPADEPRTLRLRAAGPTRLIRVVHGPGHGFVRGQPLPRRAER